MRKLRFRYLATESILAPFPIPSHPIGRSPDLPALLREAAAGPESRWKRWDGRALTVDLSPGGPFGPSPAAFLRFLFHDDEFPEALAAVRRRFGLAPLRLAGLPPGVRLPGDDARRGAAPGGRNGGTLGLLELHRLYTAITAGRIEEGLLVSVFVDPGRIFALYVPRALPLQSLFDAVPALAQMRDESPPRKAFHPISGRHLDPEKETVGRESAFICFTGSGYRLAPSGGLLFPFPLFDRRLAFRRHGTASPREGPLPCLNCLACARYCPQGLYPSLLYHNLTRGEREEAARLGQAACDRCGICSFVCPAGLPLYPAITRPPVTAA